MGKVRLGFLKDVAKYQVKETRDSHMNFFFVRAIVLCGMLLLGVLAGAYGDVIPIDSIETLQMIGNDPAYPRSGNYVLIQDIDASATASWNDGAGFAPIRYFSGFFDGQGHCISGLIIHRPDEDYAGLFHVIAEGQVENLGITGGMITGKDFVGGLAGGNSGMITQCHSSATVSGHEYVGGLVGALDADDDSEGTITQSYAESRVSGEQTVGGLVGGNAGIVDHSSAACTVSGKNYIGGLTGANGFGFPRMNGCIIQSSSESVVYGREYVGGLVGFGGYSATTQSQASGTVSGRTYVGGLIGRSYYEGTVTECFASSITTGENNVGGLVGSTMPDITFSKCCATGSVLGDRFVGGLFGDNQASPITQCYATGTVSGDSCVGGLIGDNQASSITQCYATGSVTGGSFVGGLLGSNSADISLCFAAGMVSGYIDWENSLIGGLIGCNRGSILQSYATGLVTGYYAESAGGLIGENFGAVTQCFALGDVSGTESVGGLIGNNSEETVSQCYAIGKVNGAINSTYIGGLVGQIVGGSVTACFWDTETSGQVASAGGTGITTAQLLQSGTFIPEGWDYTGVWTQTDGQTVPYFLVSSAPGETHTLTTTVTGEGLVSPSGGTYPVWSLVALTATPAASYFFMGWCGDGFLDAIPVHPVDLSVIMYADISLNAVFMPEQPDAVISIYTVEELQKIGHDPAYPLNWNYVLENDIDASATAGWNDGFGLAPIGNRAFPFDGSFDGQGHIISGLIVNRPNENYVGLFRYMGMGGTIMNLGIEHGMVSGRNYVGGLTGVNAGTISQCNAECSVAGENTIGGLVGWVYYNDGMVTQCYAAGPVIGNNVVGGLVGMNDAQVTQCHATGTVTGNIGIGGLIGDNEYSMTQCYASGTVTGTNDFAGGLVGVNWGLVTQCYALGTVMGNKDVGGLIGYTYQNVSQCYSIGAVTGNVNFGGLIGRNEGGAIPDSFWDIETSGQTTSAGGLGKTTLEMKQQATFAGWDFDAVWNIVENVTYPFLRDIPVDVEGEMEGEGISEGEGVNEGEGMPAEGEIEGIEEGEGILEGEGLGEGEGNLEGEAEGLAEGFAEGETEGVIEGEGGIEGESEGAVGSLAIVQQPRGAALYVGMSWAASILVEGGEGAVVYDWKKDGTSLGWPSAMVHIVSPLAEGDAGVYRCTVSDGVTTLESQEAVLSVYPIPPSGQHVVDQNGDWAVGLSELLRLIQFFNSAGFHCDAGSEDGYAPGVGDQTCAAYGADYAPQDWIISLSELLRIIQFFNSGCYHVEAGTEDGYGPGAG